WCRSYRRWSSQARARTGGCICRGWRNPKRRACLLQLTAILLFAVRRASEVAARRKRTDFEGWHGAANHGGNRSPRRGPGREADVLVAESEPQTGMPWRRPDHRQAVRKRRPRPAPGFADRLAKFDNASRGRHHLIELGERGGRIAGGQLDPGGDADALLHRRQEEAAFGVMDRTLQRTRRVRLELLMVAAFKGQRNTIAKRPQQIRGPGSQRDHDMARRNPAAREHYAPALAVRHDRLDFVTTDLADGASEHLHIGLDHSARR